MEWSKIKNIVILILLFVNAALLALVILRENRQSQFEAETWSGAVAALERGGITFAAEEPPRPMALPPLSVTRDRTGERPAAEALLGPLSEETDSNPVRTSYTGPGGRAEFTMGGEFQIEPAGLLLDGRDREAASLEYLAQLGISGLLLEDREQALENGVLQHTLAFCQLWEGAPLYSCRMEAIWQGDVLVRLQGSRIAGTSAPAEGVAPLSAAAILVRFLAGLNRDGDMCSRIEGMTAGYLAAGAAGTLQLDPVWALETDNGTYYVDAATGTLHRAA